MRVVPLFLAIQKLFNCFLFDERTPLCVPRSQGISECFLVNVGEGESQGSQLLASFSLWSPRQIFRHLFDLVELAYLYGNILEYREESAPPINNCRTKCPTLFFQDTTTISVVCHALIFDFVPPCVLLDRLRTKDADTVVMSPEGSVGDEDAWARYQLLLTNRDCIKLFANGDVRTIVFLCKLRQCLFAIDVVTPKFLTRPCVTPSGLK